MMIAHDWPARIITDLPAAEYHAMRALSASGAWLLAEDCPAKFLWKSPWNSLWQGEERNEFDLGTAAHLAVLEADQFAARTALINAPDYRSGSARELRDRAREEGRVPLLHWQHDVDARDRRVDPRPSDRKPSVHRRPARSHADLA
jgi:hypothetical protein